MAETHSEKVVKDTLHKMEADGDILWQMRLKQVSGPAYSTKAPLDFVVATNDGVTHWIEVKEAGRPTMQFGQFKPKQRKLLHNVNNTWLVLRFYDGEHTRAHSCYWEEWCFLPGTEAPQPEEAGSLGVAQWVGTESHLAGYKHGEKWGLSEDAGRTTRGNPSTGLTNLQIPE